MPRFNFNNITLQNNADITKVMENFNEIEQKAVINTDLATTSQNGLMSSSDKTKLNGIEAGANKIYVDKSISKANMNPVMSNTIYYALLDKVDKVSGKQLSTNDYTNTEKEKLAGIAEGATNVIVDDELSDDSQNAIQNSTVTMALDEKVDKEEGKGLSTNDYTDEEKRKLNAMNEIPYVSGTYTGDGQSERVISLGFTPSAVYVNRVSPAASNSHILIGQFGLAVTGSSMLAGASSATAGGGDSDPIITIVENGFKVYQSAETSTGVMRRNTNYYTSNLTYNLVYNYIAFK